MDTSRVERLGKYLAAVTRSRGGLERVLTDLAAGQGSPLEAMGVEGRPSFMAGRAGLENLALGRALSPDEVLSTEAIINEELRPAIDVVDGHCDVQHPLWRDLSQDAVLRQRIEAVLPSIGRIELPGHPKLPYGGTGFVVGRGLVMTNRHVAEIFAQGIGDTRLDFIPDRRAGIDFRRDAVAGTTLRVQRVVMIHPYWDMALLSVDGLPSTVNALKLSVRDARDLVAHRIFVVGYPAFDPRNPAKVQDDLFSGRYGVKRLQPGELQGAVSTSSFGKAVRAAAHDCSTLGGNSGSAVVDLDTGEVLALHFGGAYHQMNYGVPSAALSQDSRVVDAGVEFAGATPGNVNDWQDWWRQADSEESGLQRPTARAVPIDAGGNRSATPPNVTTMSLVRTPGGDLSVQVPLHITISLGGPPGAALASVSTARARTADGLDGTEAMREPFHEEGYASRRGFDKAFLGQGAEFAVPLPEPSDPAVLAPTLSGGKLLHYQNFSVAMHAKRRLALFTASNVTKEAALRRPELDRDYTRAGLSGLSENDTERWFIDTRMDPRYQLPDVFFTKDRQAFDKGHIVRREDVAWGRTYDLLRRANGDTYHVTNCSPQVAGFNQSARGEDNWGDLENHVLASAASERLCVLAGPVLSSSDQVFVGVGGGQSLRAKVPSRFWKVIVARVEDGIAAFGFVLEQDLSDVQWEEFVVPSNFEPMLTRIADIGELAGIDFAPGVLEADQYESIRGAELVSRGVATQGR